MDHLEPRKFNVIIAAAAVGFVFVLRLFYIQVIDDAYSTSADNQALRFLTRYPARGIVYDRNGEILVHNQAAFDLMVVPREVLNFDTAAFCELLGIDTSEFSARITAARNYSRYRASIFSKQLTADEYAAIAEKLWQFPGFYAQKRSLRIYPDSIAAHVLGYIGEVGPMDIEKDKFYKPGDFIGISGLERQYERELRGERGQQVLMVDVHNTVQGSFRNGELDSDATAGRNLQSTLDAALQRYGEQLMRNKKGSIVAIEPATGELLALVSAPTYDPNLLVGIKRAANYRELANNDSLNPLFDRALMAKYPPGSIFKLVQTLVALDEGVIGLEAGFPCNKSLVGCHDHPNAQDVRQAVQMSCNPYFHQVFKRLINRGTYSSYFEDCAVWLDVWHRRVSDFGLGTRLGLDLPNLKAGNVPNAAFYDRIYGHRRWAFSTIYSLSIGQGEMEVVPLQMANLAAIIANRGFYIDPHLVRAVVGKSDSTITYERHETGIDTHYYEEVIDAMQWVVERPGGTAARARIKDIEVCGKTGTAENPHGEDHSVFIAFAPKTDPKIAIAVYVENAGFGGTWAAPIASLMIEQYVNGTVADTAKEHRILEANLLNVPDAD